MRTPVGKEMFKGPRSRFWRVMGLIFLALWALGAITQHHVPWTDDMRFYVPAAKHYALWFEGLLKGDWSQFLRPAIDEAFQNNREHPPVGKYAMGLGYLVFHHWTGWFWEVEACRMGVITLWALCGTVILGVLWRFYDHIVAIAALLIFVCLPRLFFHGHAETLDMPVAAFATFSVLLFHRSIERPSWKNIAAATVVFSLALGTKLNAPFLLVGAAIYLLLRHPPRLQGQGLSLPRLPLVMLCAALLSPLIAWALWPWLWFDTPSRLLSYVNFHLRHYPILYFFEGQIFDKTLAPPWAPLKMLLITTPVVFLSLMAIGIFRPLWIGFAQLPGISRRDLIPGRWLSTDTKASLELMLVVQVAVQLLAVSLPTVPKYGGIKLFLPAFPLLAMLGGIGFGRLLHWLQSRLRGAVERLVPMIAILALALYGALGLWQYRGFYLSYYGGLTGGLSGALAAGFERQYYDLAYPEIPRALTELIGPEGRARVAIVPNGKEYHPYFREWQRRRLLSSEVELTEVAEAQYVVLTHERRWPTYEGLRKRYGRKEAVYTLAHDGVEMLSIYRR